MYRLLIVDDEQILRQGLCRTIDWNSLGFEVADEAANGEEALIKIKRSAPDVVVTDIRMPVMDGLTLLEIAFERYPEVKFVILSGFEEFDYAKRALKMGALDYVSKLTLDSDIPRVFARVKMILDQKNNEMRCAQSIRTDNARLHNRWLFKSLLDGDSVVEELAQAERSELEAMWFCIAYFLPQSTRCNFDDGIRHNAKTFLDERGIREGDTISVLHKESAIVTVHFNREPSYTRFCAMWEQVGRRDIEMGVGAHIVLGREFRGAARFAEEYALIKRCAFNCMEEKLNGVIYAKHAQDEKNDVVSVRQYNMWLQALMDGNKVWIDGQLCEMEKELRCRRIGPQQFRKFVVEFLSVYAFRKRELRDNESKALSAVYAKIPKCNTARELFELFQGTMDACVEEVQEQNRRPIEQSIETAKQYIDNHFCEKLTLQDVANAVYLSPAYFSNMFKKIVGINFAEYICKARMVKAVEYLREGKNVTQTATMVGYSDMKHFGKMFKKYHNGRLPSEFLKNQ